MGRFLLFTGEKGVGKTTAVKRVLTQVGSHKFVGFFANEVRQDGERVGFELETTYGVRGVLASVNSNSPIRVGGINALGVPRYGVELGFLEGTCIPLVCDAAKREGRVVVIDEIGPMQLFSDVFRERVSELLSEDVLVFGTIVLRPTPWADELKTMKGVETFLLTELNRETMTRMVSTYVRELLS